MNVNPVFGMDLDKDQDAQPAPAVAAKTRTKIDNTLHKAARTKKKKKVIGVTNVGGDAERPDDPASPAHAYVIDSPPAQPRHASTVAAAAKSAGIARESVTEWTGIAAVYDGDDWQESVSDFLIALVLCRKCTKTQPGPPQTPPPADAKPDPRAANV